MGMKQTFLNQVIKSGPKGWAKMDKAIDTSQDIPFKNGMLTVMSVVDAVIGREKRSYLVSESLTDALMTVDCQEVGQWHLKGEQEYHFMFKPKTVVDDSGDYFEEMFITILPPQVTRYKFKNQETDFYKLSICMMGRSQREDGMDTCTYLGTRYKENWTMDQVLEGAIADLGEMTISPEKKMEFLKLALNLVLYVNTPDPNIMDLKPQIYNTKSFRDNYGKVQDIRDVLDIAVLGWDFHGREYSVDMGIRKGHFRWQPCGAGWSQRKLIYIKESVVNYGGGK